jgi:hypothetical protein
MTTGCRVRQNNVVVFDSSLATGGVCLGIVTVPAGGGNFDFADFAGATGTALSAGTGRGAPLAVISNPPGRLRFAFPSAAAGAQVALFAK